MARKRSIKPNFNDHDDIASLSPWARLLYIGLWGQMDRNGVIECSISGIRSRVFPREDHGLLEITQWLNELMAVRRLLQFEHCGKRFLWCPTFRRHQKIYPDEPQCSDYPVEILDNAVPQPGRIPVPGQPPTHEVSPGWNIAGPSLPLPTSPSSSHVKRPETGQADGTEGQGAGEGKEVGDLGGGDVKVGDEKVLGGELGDPKGPGEVGGLGGGGMVPAGPTGLELQEGAMSGARGEFERLLRDAFGGEEPPVRVRRWVPALVARWGSAEEFRRDLEGCMVSAEDQYRRRFGRYPVERDRKTVEWRRYLENFVLGLARNV